MSAEAPRLQPVGFEYVTSSPGMISAACTICGAHIVDWPKNADGPTQERPNQDRHRAFHEGLARAISG